MEEKHPMMKLDTETGVVEMVAPGCGPALAGLVAKIIAATQEMGRVEKKGRVEFGNTKYDYITLADLQAEVRRPLLDHGVYLYRSGCMVRTYEMREGVDKYGKPAVGTYVTLDLEYVLTDGHAKLTLQAVGEARDTGDKAMQKAESSALKYVLFQNFLLQTNEDDIDDQRHFDADIPAGEPPKAAQPATRPVSTASKAAGATRPSSPATPARATIASDKGANAPGAAPANGAAPTPPPAAPAAPEAVSGGNTVNPEQMKKLRAAMAAKKPPQSETAVLRWARVQKLEEMTEVQYKALAAMWRMADA